MTKLVLRLDARHDLKGIDSYSIGKFGEEVARDYVEQVRRRINQLKDFPLSGPEFPGVRTPIRYLSCGSHRIFYDYFSDRDLVVVVRVLHQAMSPERHLRR